MLLWAMLNLAIMIAFLAGLGWLLLRMSHGGDGMRRRKRPQQHRSDLPSERIDRLRRCAT